MLTLKPNWVSVTVMSSSLRSRAAGTLRAEMARQRRNSGDLAKVLGISQSSASRRMTGETGLDLDEVEAAAAWLKIPLTSFLGDADRSMVSA